MRSFYPKSVQLTLIFFLVLLAGIAQAQGVVQGIVKDHDDKPVVGATVSIKGTNTFAVVNTEGRFSIAAPATLPFVLLVRLIGYAEQEVEVYELSEESLEI